jgi:Holliday junction resolvase RusA-like endonuclease
MTTPPIAVFTVLGRPQPAGSKKAFAIRKGGMPTGKIAVVDDAKHSRDWKQSVASAYADTLYPGEDPELVIGPLILLVDFYMMRPKAHYGTGRNAETLKASAPRYPTGKPDATKLVRAVEDALTGVLWRDDAQVVLQRVRKLYGTPERAEVVVGRVANGLGLVVSDDD